MRPLAAIIAAILLGSILSLAVADEPQTPVPDPVPNSAVMEGPLQDLLAKRIDALAAKIEANQKQDEVEMNGLIARLREEESADHARTQGVLSRLNVIPELMSQTEGRILSKMQTKWEEARQNNFGTGPIREGINGLTSLVWAVIVLLILRELLPVFRSLFQKPTA